MHRPRTTSRRRRAVPRRDDSGATRWGRWRRGQCRCVAGVDGIDGLHRSSDRGSVNCCSRRTLGRLPCTVCTVAAKCFADPASGKLTTARNTGVYPAGSDKTLQRSIEGSDRSENTTHCSAVVVAKIHPNLEDLFLVSRPVELLIDDAVGGSGRAPAGGGRRRAGRHIRREEHRGAFLRSWHGVAGAGADDQQGTAGVERRVHHPRPRRLLRRRLLLPPLPLCFQGDAGGRGGGDRARAAAAGAVARVQDWVAEARGGGVHDGEAHAGSRGGHVEAGQALRRAAAVPAVRAPRGQGFRRRRAVRRLELRPPPRRRAGARDPPAPRGRRPAEGAVGAGEGVARGVPPARRGHGLPRAHLLRRRLHLRRRRHRHRRAAVPRPASADAALRDVRRPQGRAGRRVHAVQAHGAAVPPPRLRLRPGGAARRRLSVPRAAVQSFQGQHAGGEGGQDVAAAGEEGDEGEGDVAAGGGARGGAGGGGRVVGDVQGEMRRELLRTQGHVDGVQVLFVCSSRAFFVVRGNTAENGVPCPCCHGLVASRSHRSVTISPCDVRGELKVVHNLI